MREFFTASTRLKCFGILFGLLKTEDSDMEECRTIHHVLMADDDRDHALLFERIMHSQCPSLKISYVQNGEQLMEFLRLNPVDLVFLDLRMPCKDGFECLKDIKENPAYENLPIVVYSSSAHLIDIHKSFMNHADFYLVKPFITEHLKKALEMILSVDWKDNPPIKRHYFINNSFVPYTATA